jgi:hypothetical protein
VDSDPITVEIPAAVAMWRARIALKRFGKLAQVKSIISQSDEEVQIKWESAGEVHRSDSLVASLAIGLTLTETDLDNLFITAASL